MARRPHSHFLEPDIGEKENRFMKSKIEYTKGEIGKVKIIKDFLPPPSELVLRDDNVKVTLSLSRRSIDFFKSEAKKQRVPYQKMIRRLLDSYVLKFKRPLTSQSSRRGDRPASKF